MKVKLDIDCTPAEARAFFGLPDFAPLQAEAIERLRAEMKKMDAAELIRLWTPAGVENWTRMQEAFMAAFAPAGSRKGKDES